MIEHLSTLIENFPGAANQTRCFAHILNLVAKSVLHQFDTPKNAADGDPRYLDDASEALAALGQELEDTETEADECGEEAEDNDEMGGEDDDEDGDGRDGMSEVEVDELERTLVPVRLMLTKASQFELSSELSNPIACYSFELSRTL
jgi:hypothetical protein